MATIDHSSETYALWCADCGWRWQTDYEVRRTSDFCEAERVGWFVDGHRVDSAWVGTRCPACTSLHTRVLPATAR